MANEKVEGREMTWRSLFPWTELFRGFQVALDLNKLLLAAGGILVMALGWALLAVIFGSAYSNKPDWPSNYNSVNGGETKKGWEQFRRERDQWNLMHETAKVGSDKEVYEILDFAKDEAELNLVKAAIEKADTAQARNDAIKVLSIPDDQKVAYQKVGQLKPAGTLSTLPWSEDRGPNPFLMATGQVGKPWQEGHFWDWLLGSQLLVVLEPLVKFVRPLVYFFSPRAEGFVPRLYFFLDFAWMVLTWSFFGGAITRIAAVQIARGEKIGLVEAVNFTVKRIVSYLTAPLFPIGFILVLILFSIVFGLIQLIPFFGDFVSGILWIIPLVFGLLIAVTLVGLVVGWPLMSPTISAEGTDSWEAVSRSFSYVFQKPFHYLWYSLVACVYGAILIFFIGFMGSFTVYMSKWAVSQTPLSEYFKREPTYLMVYAPDSFGWRTLLLQGAKTYDGNSVVKDGKIDQDALTKYKADFKADGTTPNWHFWNTAGAGLMAIWLGLIFLLVIGFGYSFFWSSVTIIYMLMRKTADGAELDEVYLEEDEGDGVFGSSLPPAPPTTPPVPAAKPTQPLTMVEPPALRPTPAPASSPMITAPKPDEKPAPVPSASPPPNGGPATPPAS